MPEAAPYPGESEEDFLIRMGLDPSSAIASRVPSDPYARMAQQFTTGAAPHMNLGGMGVPTQDFMEQFQMMDQHASNSPMPGAIPPAADPRAAAMAQMMGNPTTNPANTFHTGRTTEDFYDTRPPQRDIPVRKEGEDEDEPYENEIFRNEYRTQMGDRGPDDDPSTEDELDMVQRQLDGPAIRGKSQATVAADIADGALGPDGTGFEFTGNAKEDARFIMDHDGEDLADLEEEFYERYGRYPEDVLGDDDEKDTDYD